MSDLKEKYPELFAFFKGDEFAATTCMNKYLLKGEGGTLLETSPMMLIERVCKELASCMPTTNPTKEWYKSNFNSDEIRSWEEIFIEAVNSLRGAVPQGSVLSAAGNKNYVQSLSNCFVIASPKDCISSIMRAGEEEAQLMKRRGGVGIDVSTLRPMYTPVANAASTSSGAAGWMDFFSNVCRAIGQEGRRGALMITLDIKHPDAAEFAKMKLDLKKVTGANVSLRVTNEFMRAVKDGTTFTQQWPVDSENPSVIREINARDLWETITQCAWQSAEPGLIMWDNATINLPAHYYPGFFSISTNPCSEIILSAYDSCRLLTICLVEFVTNAYRPGASFDFKLFERNVRVAMRMMDAIVEAEIKAIHKILNKIRKEKYENTFKEEGILDVEENLWVKILNATETGRRTGLGTHGLADALVRAGLKYDSDEALNVIDKIYCTLRVTAYDESVEMAREYGSFPAYDHELEKDCPFIINLPESLKVKMKKYGRRNISILTNAPTGTISILSMVSSGLEPIFRLMYLRKRKVNPGDIDSRVDSVDLVGDKWQHHQIFHHSVQEYLDANNIQVPPSVKTDEELMKYLPEYFTTSDKINWRRRIEIQGVMQSHIDHSISSTVNLPADTTRETVAELYELAWEKGLKGVTVYRDGCRTGVLISNEELNKSKKPEGRPDAIKRAEAPVRPDRLPCEVHIAKVQGEEYVVIVGLMNGTVYEIFAGEHKNKIPSKSFSAVVEKRGKKSYILQYHEDGVLKEVDINKYIKNEKYQGITRLLSMSIRHGTPLEYVMQQLSRSSLAITGFESAISRILKKYIKVEDLKKLTKTCSVCNSTNIVVRHEDGCISSQCNDCNTFDSKCG